LSVAAAAGSKPSASAQPFIFEARGVPQLGREVAIALDALGRELDVAALRRHRGQREAQRVGAIIVDQISGSMTLPFDFDIFAPFSSRTRAWM
jgi:hypothetical protein